MSIIDIDSWIIEHDACERLSREIQSQLVLRNREQKLSDDYSRISGTIRVRLRQFSNELNELNKKLQHSTKQRKLTSEEAERRYRQIEVLQSKLIHLQKEFTHVATSSSKEARSKLFEQSNTNTNPSAGLWEGDDDDDDDEPIISHNNESVQDLRKQQTEILANQDRGLDALAKVISRQKDLAIRIGDEVEIQNEIIDDLAVSMENTDSRINSETRHIGIVSRKDSTCGYYIVIISLFVAIVIVLIVP